MAEETKMPTVTNPINSNTPTSNTSLSAQLITYKLYVPTILPSLNATNPKKRFVCPIEGCNKAYGKTSHIRAHLTWHSGEKPFICEEPTCMRGFTRSNELARHIRKHTGEKPFECLQCSKRFSRSDHLTKHLRVHLKPTKCNVKPMLEVSMKVEDISQDVSNVSSTDAIEVLLKQEIDMKADHQLTEGCQPEALEIEIKQETITETSLPVYVKEEDVSQDNTYALASSTDAIGVLVKQEIEMEADYKFVEECQPEASEIEIKQETITETSLPAYYNLDYPTIGNASPVLLTGVANPFKRQTS